MDYLIFERDGWVYTASATTKVVDCANIDRHSPSISCRNSIGGLVQTAPAFLWTDHFMESNILLHKTLILRVAKFLCGQHQFFIGRSLADGLHFAAALEVTHGLSVF